MLESIIAPKPEKLSHAEQTQLIQLIMAKNEDLRDSLKVIIYSHIQFHYVLSFNCYLG